MAILKSYPEPLNFTDSYQNNARLY